MKARWLPGIALLLGFVLMVPPAGHAGGVNFYWNDCVGDGGTANRAFACTATSAWTAAVGSFVLSRPLPDFVGVEVTVDFQSDGTAITPWWTFDPYPGACHGGSLGMTFDFSVLGNVSCTDPFGTVAAGGLANYSVYRDLAEAIGVAAISANNPQPLAAGVEYYGFRLALKLDKATGVGSCAGCGGPMAITLSKIKAVGLANGSEETNTSVIANHCINWNPTGFNCSRLNPVVAKNRTWGQVKSLYR